MYKIILTDEIVNNAYLDIFYINVSFLYDIWSFTRTHLFDSLLYYMMIASQNTETQM